MAKTSNRLSKRFNGEIWNVIKECKEVVWVKPVIIL